MVFLILFILFFADVTQGTQVKPIEATVVLKEGSKVTGHLLPRFKDDTTGLFPLPFLTFRIGAEIREINLWSIKSFDDGKLRLRDGSILSGELNEDVLIMDRKGTVSVMKKHDIASITILDEYTSRKTNEDKPAKEPAEVKKFPPPPPPPNYTEIFKDAFKDNTYNQGGFYPGYRPIFTPEVPVDKGRFNIPGPSMEDIFGRLKEVTKPVPPEITDPFGNYGISQWDGSEDYSVLTEEETAPFASSSGLEVTYPTESSIEVTMPSTTVEVGQSEFLDNYPVAEVREEIRAMTPEQINELEGWDLVFK